MANIINCETTIVRPSHSPFHEDHVLSLSHLDTDTNVLSTFRYLRVYAASGRTKESADGPFEVISKAVSKALVHYYPLGGTLRRRDSDGRLELFCSAGQGVPLLVANADCTLEAVNHLADADLELAEQFVPDPNPVDRLVHPCMLQLTLFKCGGFILGTSMHNAMCDGLSAGLFFNTVAELARGATEIKPKPVWDREKLLVPRNPPRVEDPLIHELLILDKGFSPYEQDVGILVKESFDVKDECLERFRSKLAEESGMKFTSFEALGAYIWRSKVKASGVADNEVVKFAYLINVRKIVKPALPIGYWGNGCSAMYVKLTAKDLIQKPLWEIAELIKKSKSNVTDEYVRSFIDFQEMHYDDGISAGKGVSGFTDWRHIGHSSVDFGWGGPVTVLPLAGNLLGSVEPCFLLPHPTAAEAKNNKDGFKVLVTLPKQALPAFQKDMELFSS